MLFMVFQFISIVWCSMDRSTQLTLAVFCGFGIWMGLGWYIIFLRFLVLILSYLLEFVSSLTLQIQKHLGTYIRCFATKQCTQRKKHPMLWTSGRSWRPFPFPKCGGSINKFSSPWVTRPPSFNRTPLEQRGALKFPTASFPCESERLSFCQHGMHVCPAKKRRIQLQA